MSNKNFKKDKKEKTYIPPDVSNDSNNKSLILNCGVESDDADEDEDLDTIQTPFDSDDDDKGPTFFKSVEEANKINKNKNMVTGDNNNSHLNPFGNSTPTWGTTQPQQQNRWQFNSGNNNSTPSWGTAQPFNSFGSSWSSSPFGNNNNNNNNPWSNYQQQQKQQQQQAPMLPSGQMIARPYYVNGEFVNPTSLNKDKRLVICDFMDCVVETLLGSTQGHPLGILPRGLYDMVPRVDVWEKIRVFSPEFIAVFVPTSFLNRGLNGSQLNLWHNAAVHFISGLSEYIGTCGSMITYSSNQDKVNIINGLCVGRYDKPSSVLLGFYSGRNCIGNVDSRVAYEAGIDFVDLYQMMTSMY